MPPKIIPAEEHESFKDTEFGLGLLSDGKINAMSPAEFAEYNANYSALDEAMQRAIAETFGQGKNVPNESGDADNLEEETDNIDEEDLDDVSDLEEEE